MALTRTNRQWLHLLARLIGLTGVVVGVVGLVAWLSLGVVDIGRALAAVGAGGVAIAVLCEIPGLFGAASSKRGAVGFNVLVQIALATLLIVGANVWSFTHYGRVDLTRDQEFTLRPQVREQLAKLRGETDIVVYLPRVSFGQRAETRQDRYDIAAQRKIVDKVKDLVELFQDLGPRFRVQVLDIEDDQYDDKLEALRAKSPKLAEAVEKAPENTIFFASGEPQHLQRLSFSELFTLDKEASREANGKRGNLVLKYQGEAGFANRIFNIDVKRPRIAAAVVHPFLSLHNKEAQDFTMNGAKKLLDKYGFDSQDILLRKLEDGDITNDATALTYDESRYEQIEDELAELDVSIPRYEEELKQDEAGLKKWTEGTLKELGEVYIYVQIQFGGEGVITRVEYEKLKKAGRPMKTLDVDEDDRRIRTTLYKQNVEVVRSVLDNDREQREKLRAEKSTLRAENLAERRRITDVQAKMRALLADVDLLVVPRFTAKNIPAGFVISNKLHRFDAAQLAAVKTFLREGKPVLFLLGPVNTPGEAPELRDPDDADSLEGALTELGFALPRQTVLYNVEMREYNERKTGVRGLAKRETEVPGVKLDWADGFLQKGKVRSAALAHPVRVSQKITASSFGDPKSYEVKLRHPRPVYFLRSKLPAELPGEAGAAMAAVAVASSPFAWASPAAEWLRRGSTSPDESAVLFVSRDESWNEENPFITKKGVPRFTPTKDDDPRKGSVEEVRRGPFPLAVAAEASIPRSWFEKDAKDAKARVAVVGQGAAFVGSSLEPAREKMLLDLVNWLLGRDELLAREPDHAWQFPRVDMDDTDHLVWQWATRLGLPLLFVYLGTVVWLVRRMR